MSRRHWLLILLLIGVGVLWVGIHGYAVAWSGAGSDLESMKAAGRAAIHALPTAALGLLLVVAAAIGLWRDR